MHKRVAGWCEQIAITIGWLGIAVLLAAAFRVILPAHSAWDRVAQEWQPYLDKMTPDQQRGVRGWFRGVRAPNGVPCCNMADGHPTDYEPRADNKFWIPDPIHLDLPRQWIPVPSEAVVHDAENPIGQAIVWWVQQGPDEVYIRCFVPGGGV